MLGQNWTNDLRGEFFKCDKQGWTASDGKSSKGHWSWELQEQEKEKIWNKLNEIKKKTLKQKVSHNWIKANVSKF